MYINDLFSHLGHTEKGYKKWRNKYVELRDAVIEYIESEPYLEHDNKTPEIEKLLKLTEGKRKEKG